LGIIYYELLHGAVPWTARSEKDLIMKIKNQRIVYTYGNVNTQNIINKMLEVNE
jgi:hydrogenase maturation factor